MKKTFVALLHGINVGGQKKIKMADLREALTQSGLENVITYIQSGNVVFQSPLEDIEALEHSIKKVLATNFGHDVPTLVLRANDIERILDANPFADSGNENALYYVFLHQAPRHDLVEQLEEMTFINEDFYVTENCVYLMCKKGYGKAKLNNNLIEEQLKVVATTRNHTTMQKLWELVH